MSAGEAPAPERPGEPAPSDTAAAQDLSAAEAEPEERPQEARAARRELYDHAPEFMFKAAASFGGSLVGGSQHGVSGGRVDGDVFMGGKTESHHYYGSAGPVHASGEIPAEEVESLAAVFEESDSFATALERLRGDRIVVLTGAHSTGRRAAALMLLHRLGITTVRALDAETPPAALREQLGNASGHVLCDLALSRGKPLKYNHLLAAQDELRKRDGHLVITLESTATLTGITPVPWKPPSAAAVLRAHLRHHVGDGPVERLLGLSPVRDFLAHAHQLREVRGFAEELAAYDSGSGSLEDLAAFSRASVEEQVRQWFGNEQLSLRDKSFLVSLAVFDQAPYPLAAELADQLYVLLQETENPARPPEIPVFGPAITDRLQLARAQGYEEYESTEWGQVPQFVARFQDDRIARTLLDEVWTGHPSARPALIRWIQRLAHDGRPVVRTRAAATAAMLTAADLPSAMALLIDGWATARGYAPRQIAANTLTLSHLLGAPAVPRILSQWCLDDHPARRWTAVRAYALLVPLRPEQTEQALEAIAARTRLGESDARERNHFIQSTALLLSAGDRRATLTELVRLLEQDTASVRALVLSAFLTACHAEEDGLLAWFTEDDDRTPAGIGTPAALWRAALADPTHTKAALTALRTWVYEADRHPSAEEALTALLPALAVSAQDTARLSHLLRTLPGEHGGPPPAAAARLLSALPSR
ncbi:hypothetical protein GCM10017744_047170 [Streptomyces antimycoticus]|uniref:Rhodanese domain-containing protein n=1 Tax=Streptomyces antimycoticus TaxID=68175 RepID=A0A4D4KDG4_9ACTN|nr:hypothetical protein [Streptomyces antimycoticus]GDY44638.1 hypothetical protein SANT12839_055200 [Streptomyces antimycoticus]